MNDDSQNLTNPTTEFQPVIDDDGLTHVNLYKRIFEQMLDEVHVWQLVLDEAGKIKTWKLVDANACALQSWGKQLEEVVGKTTDEIFPGANATELFKPIVEKIFKDNKPYQWESYFPGTNQTLLMKSIPIGNIFVSTGIDISELKRTQKELESANLRLTESIRAGRVAIWDWHITEDLMIWDDLMYEIYGVEKGTRDSVTIWENALHPKDADKAKKALSDALAGNSDYSLEFRIVRPSGEVRYINGDGTVIRDENDKPTRMLGTNIDITEHKQLQRELHQSQKMEAIGQLAGGIAHDFNNQLASILGFTEILATHLKDSPRKHYLEKIMSCVDASSGLTKQLLSFSRKSKLSLEPLDVHRLIQDSIEILSRSFDKKIEFETKLSSMNCTIIADKTLLQNALFNLCINARDAMPNGGTLSIETECLGCSVNSSADKPISGENNQFIKILVKDSGIGIPENEKVKIFEPFYTTKDLGAGTGLGLASVYSTITQLKGEISVESEVGVGTCFEIILPLSADQYDVTGTDLLKSTLGDSTIASQTILFAEDEQLLRELCTEYVHVLGHKGIFVCNGKEAVEKYQQNWQQIDLVILDMMMAIMDGKEAFMKMKELNPAIKAIVASGYSGEHTKQNLLADGVKAALSKPFKLAELKSVIDEVVDK